VDFFVDWAVLRPMFALRTKMHIRWRGVAPALSLRGSNTSIDPSQPKRERRKTKLPIFVWSARESEHRHSVPETGQNVGSNNMIKDKKWMLYGCTGYSGKLIAAECKRVGLTPVLAGRSEAKVKAIADAHGFAYRVFDLVRRHINWNSI
jgi:hypothetical protein